jgi:hypothetical protein
MLTDNEIKEYRQTERHAHTLIYIKKRGKTILVTCKILGFHGGDYEECRLMGYKNPVRTSQETYYIYATETSRLIICKI